MIPEHRQRVKVRVWTRHTARWFWYSVLAIWMGFSRHGAAMEPVTFRFTPPDGVEFTRTTKITRTKQIRSRLQTDISTTVSTVLIKQVARGYSLVETPVSYAYTRDGKSHSSAHLSPVGLTFTYELAHDGRLIRIRGFDQLARRLNSSAGSPPFSEQGMVRAATDKWDERIGGIVGRQLVLGEEWTGKAYYQLPTGVVAFSSAGKLTEKMSCQGRPCVRLHFSYHTDTGAVKKLLNWTLGDITKGLRDSRIPISFGSEAEIVGGGERIIEPATMLVHSEAITLRITAPVALPNGSETSIVVWETREETYTYGK